MFSVWWNFCASFQSGCRACHIFLCFAKADIWIVIIHVENVLICQRVKYQYNIGDLYETGKNDN